MNRIEDMGVEDFDSKDEWEFARWILGMESLGLILKRGYHPLALQLSDKVTIPYTKQLKTKTKECERHFLHPCSYQADFIILPDYGRYPAHEGLWFGMIPTDGVNVWTDVKGSFSKFHDGKQFSIVQKWVWQVHGIAINKVVNKKLFEKTFCPEEVRIGKSGKLLKKWSGCPTIEEFGASL